jgi:hypothetical protein
MSERAPSPVSGAQLEEIAAELRAAEDRLRRLAERLPDERWGERPEPGRWSVGECVAHLNLTARAYLPILDRGLAEASALGGGAPRRYRRELVGWLLWRTMGPPVRFRTRTAAAFVPEGGLPPAGLRAEFSRLQAEQIRRVEAAAGLPIDRVRVTSPFAERVRYDLFSCLGLLPRHQHRHLWQAEEVAARLLAGPRGA